MTVIDIEGREISVTDLDTALKVTAEYMHMQHDPPRPEQDSRLQAYWSDLHNKILALKETEMLIIKTQHHG